LRQIAGTAPELVHLQTDAGGQAEPITPSSLSVIIPAYNEATNIRDCVLSVLQAADGIPELGLWVVDDQSQDETLSLARSLQAELHDARFRVLSGAPRPDDQVWLGKNWACHQAAVQATGEFLLFLDADVRLKPGAIATVLTAMQQKTVDLLTICPAIVCGCWAEWLVQPLMISLLLVGFDFNAVNDPTQETAFAAGPFMLFRRSAYDQLGGHAAVADQVVEDVELARRVKQQGLTLRFVPAPTVAQVQMYRSGSALWEGWTKNWHLGSRRNWSTTLYSALIVLVVCVLPWLSFLSLVASAIVRGLNGWEVLALAIATVAVILQWDFRQSIAQVTAMPPRYWWLSGLGGIGVIAIVLTSIVKTETGWGWTWRGRSLKLPSAS
jgi:cellulose synthase/poly-beta-1,6-N-acetylglucosamine synthase-like glycosyltransferase